MAPAQLKQKFSVIDSLILGIFTIALWLLGCNRLAIATLSQAQDEKSSVALTDGTPGNPNTAIVSKPKIFNPQSPKVFNPGANKSAVKRHKISLSVVSLDDLKVADGDTIAAGDLVSDRTEQRLTLESQIARIESAISQSEQGLSPMPALPLPDFSKELAEVDKARETAEYWASVPEYPQRFKGELAKIDYKTLDKQQKLEVERMRSRLAVETALARLETAKQSWEKAKYRHQLEQASYEANRQQQEYQIGQLQQQLADLQDKLSRLSVVKSPVSGTVRRVRILGQSDRTINVEVIIDAEPTSSVENS